MNCSKCGNELRVDTEQVGVDDRMLPVFHRFGYCDKCMLKYDLDEQFSKEKQAQKNESKKENINKPFVFLGGLFIFFCCVLAFCGKNQDSKQTNTEIQSSTQQKTEYQSTEIVTTESVKSTDSFIDDFSKETNLELSEKLFDILVNQIGFSEIVFCENIEDTDNYSILANDRNLVVTVIDNDFRIFKPNSDIVLYENGQLLMTNSDMEEKIVDPDEAVVWFAIAQGIIEENLKNPKSADFPSHDEAEYQVIGNIIAVRSFVYAENSFGAEVKSNWVVQFMLNEDESYVVNYIEIDGQKTGEFITE